MARSRMARRRSRAGFSLTELMISLLLGAVVLVALLRAIGTATAALRSRDAVAEARERARFALASLEPDIQMAGFYGLSAQGADFGWLSAGDIASAASAGALRQSAPPLAAAPPATHECGDNFALDLAIAIQASDDAYGFGAPMRAGCQPNGSARPGSDTLTIRRASSGTSAPAAGRVQLLVDRSDERRRWLFADGVLPPGLALATGLLQCHDLELRSYYIANDSVGQRGSPALRVKSLTSVAGAPAYLDTEVMPGIEDLQVRLQTDSGIYDPQQLPAGAQVRAVQIWLRVRAITPEPGFTDRHTYRYADVETTPGSAEAHYRRLLVTRIIAVRNAGGRA